MMKNPFYYGGVVTEHHFCNRTSELKELVTDFHAGLNVLLYAPRRFGKTSLVLESLKQAEYQYIFLDLMSIIDEKEFIEEYFNAISKKIVTNVDKIVNQFKKIFNFKPDISIDFDVNGNPVFRLKFLHNESKLILKEVLDLPYKYAKYHKKRIIVVFDEFQEIIKLGIDDKLRSVIQHHHDMVSYVFLGSKKSIMKNIFFNNSNPFYRSVKHISINKIDNKEWQKYISNGFISNGKHINVNQINKILETSKGFPYYTQQIANELFNLTDKSVSDQFIDAAINLILEKEEDLFWNQWDNLSRYQKKASKYLINVEGKHIYTKEKMLEYSFTNSSLKKAIEGLMNKDIIDVRNGEYYFQDPLFELFIKRM